MAGPSAAAHWTSDFRQTLRMLRRSPGHVALVIACLGIGLAASIAVFSIVNALLYGEQPGVRDRQSLVRVYVGHDQARGTERVSGGREVAADPLALTDYRILGDHGPALTGLAAEGDLNMAVLIDAGAVGVRGALVSGSYFGVLGTPSRLGRLLTPADDRPEAPPVVVVSDRFWRTYLDGRPDAIGRTLVVSGRSATIVGVAPPRFSGIQPPDPAAGPETTVQLWLPLSLAASWPGAPSESTPWLYGIGRLAPGVSRPDAATGLAVAARRIEAAYPTTRAHATIVLRPQGFGPGDSPTDVLALLVLFLSVPVTVLAIACANVANLQLARATDRTHELAVRLSLGATRGRLVRLLTIESLMLALAAVLVGGAGAVVALRLSAGWLPLAISFDWHVAVFAVGLVCAVTVVTGLAPAWLVLRRAIASGLRQAARTGGSAHARLRNALVVTQVALSLVLLFMGVLFTRSVEHLNGGIPPLARQLIVTRLDLKQAAGYSRADAQRFADAVTARLARDPRIAAAGFADFLPAGEGVRFSTPGSAREETSPGGFVMPGWFDVMRARVLAGRLLTGADAGARVAVVNATLAARLARPGGTVVGSTLFVRHGASDATGAQPVLVEIVGVIADPLGYPDGHREPAVYLPMPVEPPTSLVLMLRAEDPEAARADLRRALASIDPRLPWMSADTVATRVAREISPIRYVALSVGGFGSLALVFALVGLYAVLAYVVSLRRREIGVRVAMGAAPRDVMGLVVRQSLRLVATGGAIGLGLALPLAFALRAVLFGVSPVDPLALAPTLGAVGLVAVVAAAFPARRAARLDPVRALRED